MILQMQPMRRAGGGPKTYADFVTWVDAQPALSVLPSSSAAVAGEGLRKTQLAGFSGAMRGSPWNENPAYGSFSSNSVLRRIAQHAFAAETHATMNVNRLVMLRIASNGLDAIVSGLDRNGYGSLSYPFLEPASYEVWLCDSFDYFNEDTGRRVHVNPLLQIVEEFDL